MPICNLIQYQQKSAHCAGGKFARRRWPAGAASAAFFGGDAAALAGFWATTYAPAAVVGV
jgi:hypothetical protein